MLPMSRGGCRRPRLPAALCTLLLLQYQQVPGTNAHPANEDDSNNLEMIEGIISMPNFKNNMMVLFPLDYKVETNVLPDIKAEDEICTTGLSFHLLNNDLKHLNSHLHEQHPVQKHINDILDEMSVLDILKKITKSYSKTKISPSELIYKLQSVLGYLKKYKADFKTFQNHLESCIFLHHTEKPTVAGNTHISLSTATYSDETLTTNTSMYLDNQHETTAARGLDQSVTIGTFNRVRNMFTNSMALDEVNATSNATAQAIANITSSAVSHREVATPPMETNSTGSYASDSTLLTSFVTRVTASTNNERIDLDSTTVSGHSVDSTQTGTGGATVAPSKVTSDGDLNLGTSPDKQVNATGTPRFIGNFSAASPSEPSFSSSTKREQIESSTRPSKNIASHPTESTRQTSRGTTTDHHQAKRPDAVPTLANGSELPPSSDSYPRPAKRHNEGPPIDPLKPADQRHQCSTSAANRTVHTDTVLFLIMGIYMWCLQNVLGVATFKKKIECRVFNTF
ncbi:uncharacterized protein LOC116954146 isoform X1 [Petromyzon marinus]|uniref:uncharacterized protein LOC116954146 isoform X1 n=1 Tax=Petromyzon marinus TaxID=7757 RepID=UPI003F6F20D1